MNLHLLKLQVHMEYHLLFQLLKKKYFNKNQTINNSSMQS